MYAYDRPHTAAYYAAASAGPEAFARDYLQTYVLDCPDHAAYIARVGGSGIQERLGSWSQSNAAWMDLYREVPV
jgi:glutaconate CoA-transferase subunit A